MKAWKLILRLLRHPFADTSMLIDQGGKLGQWQTTIQDVAYSRKFNELVLIYEHRGPEDSYA